MLEVQKHLRELAERADVRAAIPEVGAIERFATPPPERLAREMRQAFTARAR